VLYEIRVDGRVDPSVLADFATVTATAQPPGTVLACDVVDAAALTGMIAMLSDRGIVVHDVHEVMGWPRGGSRRAAEEPSASTERAEPSENGAP
jgi:hypothetical protein